MKLNSLFISNSEMYKYFLRLLTLLTFFFIFDKVFVIVQNRSAKVEIDKRLEYLLKGEINKDLIILSSSTGARNIIASDIEKSTGLESFNLSYPGSDVEFHEFLLRALILFNKAPKFLVLVVDDPAELIPEGSIAFRFDRLYPLVKYKFIRDELINRGKMDEYLSRVLIVSRLNKSNFDLRGKRFSALDTIMECGSMPISFQRPEVNWQYGEEQNYNRGIEMPEKVVALEKIVEHCNNAGIDLIVVSSPTYKEHSKSFENRIRELCGSGVHYYIFDTSSQVYKDQNYFYDMTHLMRTGAEVFTKEFVNYLIEINSQMIHLSANEQ